MWRNVLPLIVVAGVGVSAILWALWYNAKRKARERLSAERRKRQANKRTVDGWDQRFDDLGGGR